MPDEDNFYKELIDNLHDGIYFVDRERVITYWNKGAARITGYDSGRVTGHACHENILNHVSANGVQLCHGQCPLAACMADGKPREAEVFLHHADGHRVPVLVKVAPVRDANGLVVGAVETFNNNSNTINARHQLRELRRTVNSDMLTGVGNRRFLEGQLRGVVAEFDHQPGAAGLLFLDIDNFKNVNDTFGHEVGDQVLRMVAATLRQNLRATDAVGRWGGEEFIVILHDIASEAPLRAIAEKLCSLVETSRLDLDEVALSVTFSTGATLLRPEDTPETWVHRADQLMYKSKQSGGNRVSVG